MPGSITSPSTIASASSGVDGDLHELGLALRVIDDRDLDQAGADVETDRRLLATERAPWEPQGDG